MKDGRRGKARFVTGREYKLTKAERERAGVRKDGTPKRYPRGGASYQQREEARWAKRSSPVETRILTEDELAERQAEIRRQKAAKRPPVRTRIGRESR